MLSCSASCALYMREQRMPHGWRVRQRRPGRWAAGAMRCCGSWWTRLIGGRCAAVSLDKPSCTKQSLLLSM